MATSSTHTGSAQTGSTQAPGTITAADCARGLRALGIDADDSTRRRWEYSYDASNYRITPLCVVFPRTPQEVATAVRWCYDNSVAVIARSGGTGMGGNTIGAGVVIDTSRYMTAISDVDAHARTAHAQAGVVLTELGKHVRVATDGALTFAPDPSSQTRACIGGAIGNDACGNHSVRYGRTTDHIVDITVVTADGFLLTATRLGIHASDPSDAAAVARAAQISVDLHRLVDSGMAILRTELERIPRQVSGYHLAHLLPEHGFDVARALVGTEGTCAVVVSATVNLVATSRDPHLLCLGYRDVVDAARDVPTMLEFAPSAIEGIDEAIVATMRFRRGRRSVEGLPDGNAWIYVELDAESVGGNSADIPDAIEDLAEKLRAQGRLVDHRTVTDPTMRSMLWRVREDGAGLSSRLVNPDDPDAGAGYESWPGWEDSAVAPENLPEYLEGFRELLARHSLTGVMYGHFGAGCMHVRITFDQRTEAGRAVMNAFVRDAAQLVVDHGGSLSGEHGDGRARSQLLPIMYSPQMLGLFATFKHVWDPTAILNPGSIVDPDAIDANLALADVPHRTWSTAFDLGMPGDGEHTVDPFVHAAQACIGVGRCRTHTGGVMCPSYRATRDEKDSTRARARVLQEMMRSAPNVESGWRSEEVRESLDLCLSCKACSSDCPTGVDMATYRSEFFSHYYRGRKRPMSHYALGWMPAWLKAATLFAPLVNSVLETSLARPAARIAGLDGRRSMPKFARSKDIRAHLGSLTGHPDAPVVLFLDSFTTAFRPEVAAAAARVLSSGLAPDGSGGDRTVSCAKDNCCGLTWISTGQLDHAKKVLTKTAAALDDGTDRPIVVPEPSCAAALAKDLPELIPTDAARRVAARVRSFATYVSEMLDAGFTPPPMPTAVTVQTHCHEYAVFGATTQASVLRRLGVTDVTSADGCCGVAGNFGFERGHYEVSMSVAEQSLAPALRARDDTSPVLTDGFSCAMAVDHLAGVDSAVASVTGTHLAQLLDPLRSSPSASPTPTHPAKETS